MPTPYTDDNLLILDYFETDALPAGTILGEGWKLYVGDPAGLMVFLGTIAQVRQALAPLDLFSTQAPTVSTPGREGQKAYVSHDSVVDLWQYELGAWVLKLSNLVRNATAGPALSKPAKPTFSNFQDTQAGGSVLLVPATGLSPGDYYYRITSTGNYQLAPPDGLITVGNITGEVYAYSAAVSGTRQQSDVAVSGTFTAYSAPTPGATTPDKPTFTNFDDAANLVQLVPTAGVPMSAYQVRIGTAGAYAMAPADGVISVPASFAGQVFAYSVADTGRNVSLTAASPSFTAAVVLAVPGAPTNLVATASTGSAQPTIMVTGLAPSNNGGSTITDYNVYVNGAGTATNSFAPPSGNQLSFLYNGATIGAGDYFQFTALNAQGEGPKSAPSNTATPTGPVAPPSFAQVLNPGDNVDTLTFDAASQGQVLYNNPVQPTATVPGAAAMNLFYPDLATQVGYLNFDPADIGHAMAYQLGGVTYYKNAGNGAALTFTDGSVLLGN